MDTFRTGPVFPLLSHLPLRPRSVGGPSRFKWVRLELVVGTLKRVVFQPTKTRSLHHCRAITWTFHPAMYEYDPATMETDFVIHFKGW
jgi:hypothetical protein